MTKFMICLMQVICDTENEENNTSTDTRLLPAPKDTEALLTHSVSVCPDNGGTVCVKHFYYFFYRHICMFIYILFYINYSNSNNVFHLDISPVTACIKA